MANILINNSRVLGSTDQVYDESCRLVRLTKLYDAKREQPELIADIQDVWSNVYDQIDEQNRHEVVSKALNDPKIQRVKDCYKEIQSYERVDDIRACAASYLRDTDALIVPPRIKSSRGTEGPTFIVSYPRSDVLNGYVVKWTDQTELDCHRLYEAFSLGFSVPKMASIDFDALRHQGIDGQVTQIGPGLAEKMLFNFLEVSGNDFPEEEYTKLMLSQKVHGENLIDFATAKYSGLNEAQKYQLFKSLGRISLMDVITGNLDRLVYLLNSDNLELHTAKINFGNVMIDLQNKEPVVYAIDNGANPDLMRQPYINKLTSFFNSLISTPGWEAELAQHITVNFHVSIRMVGNPQLLPLAKDLDSIAKPGFEEGIKEMAQDLRQTLIPIWQSGKADTLKESIGITSPGLVDGVEQRLGALMQAKI
jgi:hypothetical protein